MSSTELSGYSLVKLDEISWPTSPPQPCLRADKPNTSAAAMVIEIGGGGEWRSDLCVYMSVCMCRGVGIGGAASLCFLFLSTVIDEEPRRSFSLKLSSTL